MANKNRNKGNYHEKWFISWLERLGFKAKRQPLSGQLGGEYRGDILWQVGEHELVVEVKYRDSSSFPSAFAVLAERDAAFYKRKSGDTKTLVIIDGDIFEKCFAPLLRGETKTKKKRRKRVPENWQPSQDLIQDINTKLQESINHDDETHRFRDHHISKGSLFANIDTAYRNWCRNSIKYRKERESSSSSAGSGKPQYHRQKPSFFAGVHNRVSSD